jgi:hypothetical protein
MLEYSCVISCMRHRLGEASRTSREASSTDSAYQRYSRKEDLCVGARVVAETKILNLFSFLGKRIQTP